MRTQGDVGAAILFSLSITAAGAPAGAQEESAVQEVVVTGSRIARPESELPSPIVTSSAEDIEASGKVRIVEFLADIPALTASRTNQPGGNPIPPADTQTGVNTLNLRNLGENRTLVLVDGRRHVPAVAGTSAVDVNSIPTDLIERVDVISGGASAVYGADAVSGVVNFIMKKDFEGLSVRPQVGISQRGDGKTQYLSVVGGRNFAEGRGNVALAYEVDNYDGLRARERYRYRPENIVYLTANPADPDFPDDPSIPDNIPQANIRIPYGSNSGAYDIGFLNPDTGEYEFDYVPEFNGRGEVVDPGLILPNFLSVGGNGSLQGAYDYPSMVRTEAKRHVVNLISHFEVSPAVEPFIELKYAANDAVGSAFPTYQAGDFIQPDNAFIPDVIRAVAPGGLVLVERDNMDYGVNEPHYEQRTMRAVVGLRGTLRDWVSYEASYVQGRTKTRSIFGERLQDRYYAATDAVIDPSTGQPTCRSNLDPSSFPDAVTFTPGAGSGCVPFNIFGEGVADPRAVEWIAYRAVNEVELEQKVANLTFTGTLDPLFRAPGGSIGFAFGTEWRREASDFRPDPASRDGLIFYGGSQPLKGHFSVKEAFAEISVPLVADAPLAYKVNLGAAIRASDYTSSGRDDTWKFDALYMPVRGLGLRGTLAKAVRSPNIGELYQGQATSAFFPLDPCDIQELASGTSFRAANCAALLTSLGVDPSTYRPNSRPVGVLIDEFTSGNPNLDPEEARTWTAGIVLDSLGIDGLSASLDWYDIEITDAISSSGLGTIIDQCVDQPTLDNAFCPLVDRENGTGYIVSGRSQPVNVAAFRTSGLDLTLNYRLATSRAGGFNFRLVAGYLDRLTFIDAPGAEPREESRGLYAPKRSAMLDVAWNLGRASVNYGVSWWDNASRFSRNQLRADPDIAAPEFLDYNERWQHDVHATVRLKEGLEAYGGINNLLDEKPDFGTVSYPVEPLGRYFYFGVKLDF